MLGDVVDDEGQQSQVSGMIDGKREFRSNVVGQSLPPGPVSGARHVEILSNEREPEGVLESRVRLVSAWKDWMRQKEGKLTGWVVEVR